MNKTICISDFSFDDEILRKLNELDTSLRKPKSYFMRIDIQFPKNLDQKTISTFSQRYSEKINDKTFFKSRIKKKKWKSWLLYDKINNDFDYDFHNRYLLSSNLNHLIDADNNKYRYRTVCRYQSHLLLNMSLLLFLFFIWTERCNELQNAFIEKFDYFPCHIRVSRFFERTTHQLHSELVGKRLNNRMGILDYPMNTTCSRCTPRAREKEFCPCLWCLKHG